MLLLPSLAAAGEPHPLLMERTSLTVSVVNSASTEDPWPLLQRSVSSTARGEIMATDWRPPSEEHSIGTQLLRGE